MYFNLRNGTFRCYNFLSFVKCLEFSRFLCHFLVLQKNSLAVCCYTDASWFQFPPLSEFAKMWSFCWCVVYVINTWTVRFLCSFQIIAQNWHLLRVPRITLFFRRHDSFSKYPRQCFICPFPRRYQYTHTPAPRSRFRRRSFRSPGAGAGASPTPSNVCA